LWVSAILTEPWTVAFERRLPRLPVTGRRVETGAILRRPALEDRPDG
jgi:hypothetical protein